MKQKQFLVGIGLLLVGLVVGGLAGRWFPTGTASSSIASSPTVGASAAEITTQRKVLYWANPMNPKIHSDHPMKDNMGMDYIPVYASAPQTQRRVLYWANPMNPAIHSDHPMKDNMGMDYVPVYASSPASSAETPAGLQIDARTAQNLGVRLTTVQMRTMGQAVQTVGTVALDQNRIVTVTPRFSGWVVNLRVRAVGDAVRRGQVLADIYSPELYSAEQDYLIARQQTSSASDANGLLAAAEERLRLLGMPETALAELETTGKALRDVPILAPETGVVTSLNIRQGGYVSQQANLLEIANLDRVWVNVALYDYQMPWVRLGDPVQLQLPAYPGKTWDGRLSFFYPTLDAQTRTVTARLTFPNIGGLLRPGMYANATVLGHAQTALAVPSSAVLRTQDGDFAMLAQPGGHFLPVQVTLGPEAQGWVTILQGLKAGDQIVESAQFLLYSESQFQSVKARLLGGNTGTDTAPPANLQSNPAAALPTAPASESSMAGMNMPAAQGGSHD